MNKFYFLLCFLLLPLLPMACNHKRAINSDSPLNDSEYNCYNDSSLSVDPENLSLGIINPENTHVKPFIFTISNNTDNIMIINSIDVSCSCVKIIKFPQTLKAGDSGQITGEINLKNQSGHLRKSIFVTYNDSSLRLLKITADIKK